MGAIISALLNKSKAMIFLLFMIFLMGTVAFLGLPKESFPNIDLGYVRTMVAFHGASPDDIESLITDPIEDALKPISEIKEIISYSSEGSAFIISELHSEVDIDDTIDIIKDKIDLIKGELPPNAEEPIVEEIRISEEFPDILFSMQGDAPLHVMQSVAKEFQEAIENVPLVSSVDIIGYQEEQVEILVDPVSVAAYNLTVEQAMAAITSSDQVVTAGINDTGIGRIALRSPGTFESIIDIANVIVSFSEETSVKLSDIAEIKRSFKDRTDQAWVNGSHALVLKVVRESGENIINMVDEVKVAADKVYSSLPDEVKNHIEVSWFQDNSTYVKTIFSDLTNNVLIAIILVMFMIMVSLGIRSSILVGISVPGSFCAALIIISQMGLTLNMMVMFGLILAVGILVDGAVVVIEYADRKMQEGLSRKEAYKMASIRMFAPVSSSTATTLAAFLPLLFWPGIVGQFMRMLPLTIISVMTSSLVMALIFVPILGGMFGKPAQVDAEQAKALSQNSTIDDMLGAKGVSGAYVRLMHKLLKTPISTVVIVICLIIFCFNLNAIFGKGTEYFPVTEPDFANIEVFSHGNYSSDEVISLMEYAEKQIPDTGEIRTIYTQANVAESGKDRVGFITLEFEDISMRRKAEEILDDIRVNFDKIPGIDYTAQISEDGPPVEGDVVINISGNSVEKIEHAIEFISSQVRAQSEFSIKDIENNISLKTTEINIDFQEEVAAGYGISINNVGSSLELITNGVHIGDWRPDNLDRELEIRIRYPKEYRTLSQIDNMRISMPYGDVPISNFTTKKLAVNKGTIIHKDGKRSNMLILNLNDGVDIAAFQNYLKVLIAESIKKRDVAYDLEFEFEGELAEQAKEMQFLSIAMILTLLLIFVILLAQFNSFFAAFLVLTTVAMSISGVLLGNVIMGLKFSIIMSGVGVVALAGIVVNNNIVLIDTYYYHLKSGRDNLSAILLTCGQRIRPVLLTTITTILGLMPMVSRLNIDIMNAKILFNTNMSQMWSQISTAIAFGLAFSTILTLVFTPSCLYLAYLFGKNKATIFKRIKERIKIIKVRS